MTNDEFQEAILKLADNFSRKISDSQTRRLYYKFSYLSDGRFEKLSDHIINNYTKKEFDFTISAFKNALRETTWSPSSESNNKKNCNRCSNSGFVSYALVKNHINYSFAARCDCEYGEELSVQIPRYDDLFPGETIYNHPKNAEPVGIEDIKALLVLMNHPELLKPVQGKHYDKWRAYITKPEIVQVLMG